MNIRTIVIAGVVLVTGLTGGAATIASAQPSMRSEAVEVQALISTWPAPARKKALEMIKRNGMPDEITDSALVWNVGKIQRRAPKPDPTIVEGSIVPQQQFAGGEDH